MRYALVGLAVVGVCSCAHTVPQDAATGRDGKIKGAVPIKLDNNEGVARGIVTYPGGDRVDWRSIELPATTSGTLELKMTYTTPRPGLRVAFDVFDQFNTPIAIQRAVAKRSREATIDHAKGTYFVRVYAPRRGDAGTYKLAAAFTPDLVATGKPVEVAEPPKLPAVPPTVEDCLAFDAHNPSCATACPDDAPTNWKGCPKELCRTPDVNNPACQKTMACVVGQADRRIAACMANPKKYFQACNRAAPDPANPLCDILDPVVSRIIHIDEAGGEVTITIAAGSNQHVDKGWTVTILAGGSDKPLPGGTATITHVERTKATARVHLRREVVEANQNLRLTPP
jgi:hypothetical protein